MLIQRLSLEESLEALFPVLVTANALGDLDQPVLSCYAYPEDGVKFVLHAGKVTVLLRVLLGQLLFLDFFFHYNVVDLKQYCLILS